MDKPECFAQFFLFVHITGSRIGAILTQNTWLHSLSKAIASQFVRTVLLLFQKPTAKVKIMGQS